MCVCVSVFRREGEGMRIFWDRLREPAFSSRWNPFTVDYPYCTLAYHPVRNVNDRFAALCEVSATHQPLPPPTQQTNSAAIHSHSVTNSKLSRVHSKCSNFI